MLRRAAAGLARRAARPLASEAGASSGLPPAALGEVAQPLAEEELAQRRGAVVRSVLKASLGEEKAELARLLGAHGVACRGGPEAASALMDALLAWKQAA